MEVKDKIWMYIGAVAIVAFSLFSTTTTKVNPLASTPLLMVILAWTLSYGFVVVMPLIYLVEFKLLHNKESFGIIVLSLALFVFLLTVLYFWVSWGYGIKYHGEVHTRTVAVENLIGFIILLVLSYAGVRRKSKVLQCSANLYLFLMLTCCAFPYLGELP